MLAKIMLLLVQRFHSLCIQHLFFACLVTFKLHNLAYLLRINSFIFLVFLQSIFFFFFSLLNFLIFSFCSVVSFLSKDFTTFFF